MDRLIKAAWRTFWVGLGAAAVLISQSVLSPPPSTAPTADPAAAPPEAPRPQLSPAAARRQAADPVLSTLPRCATVASTTRCT